MTRKFEIVTKSKKKIIVENILYVIDYNSFLRFEHSREDFTFMISFSDLLYYRELDIPVEETGKKIHIHFTDGVFYEILNYTILDIKSAKYVVLHNSDSKSVLLGFYLGNVLRMEQIF